MMQARILLSAVFSFTTTTWAVEPPSAAQGETLHAAHCSGCHDTALYTRPDRKVTTLAKLEAQVRGCDVNLNLGWFDEDILSMTAYLNQRYYHFKP